MTDIKIPAKKKTAKRKKAGEKNLDPAVKSAIKIDYLKGIQIEKISKKHGLPKKRIENLIINNKWKKELEKLISLTEEKTIEQIAENKSMMLAQMDSQAAEIIDKVMTQIRNDNLWNPVTYMDKEENMRMDMNFDKMEKLGKLWNTAWARRLRAIGEPDVIKDAPDKEKGGEVGTRKIQVLTMVGVTQKVVDDYINGESKNEKTVN